MKTRSNLQFDSKLKDGLLPHQSSGKNAEARDDEGRSAMSKGKAIGSQNGQERANRSVSGIPSASTGSRSGAVSNVISNISSGIAQKKQMLKGIWSRGSSNGSSSQIGQQKNENIDPSNITNRGQSLEVGNSKIGMGTSHLSMSSTGINMMQFKNQKQIGKGEHPESIRGGVGSKAQVSEPKIINKNST